MIHYSCDFCGNPIRSGETRFEVRIEVRHGSPDDPDACVELPDDADGVLAWLEDEGFALSGEPANRCLRFDLCPDCQAAFLAEPLARPRTAGFRAYDN